MDLSSSRRKFFSIKILRHKVGQLAQPSESLEFVQFRPRQCLGESEGGRHLLISDLRKFTKSAPK